MKPLDQVKAKFLEIFPIEENVRERRFMKAGYKCEMCGDTKLLQLHHVINKDGIRRKLFERVFSVRVLCYCCHQGKEKGKVENKYRKEICNYLQDKFSNDDIILITGRKIY